MAKCRHLRPVVLQLYLLDFLKLLDVRDRRRLSGAYEQRIEEAFLKRGHATPIPEGVLT
jgi:hypothetical protein